MRPGVTAAVVLWLTPVCAVGAHAFGASFVSSLTIGGAVAMALGIIAGRPLADLVAPLREYPAVLALTALLALASIAQIARTSVYMADPSRTDCSYAASEPWRVRHSCMTAYAEAVRFAQSRDGRIYDMARYEPRTIGPLKVDSYHYPPVFLLLPAAVRALRADIFGFRALWFVMQSLILVGAIFGAAKWIGSRPGAWVACGGVFALATPQFLYSLQQGNIQSTAIPLGVLAMILLVTQRLAGGALMLAYLAAAKIFPGILLVYLAGARRWRALILTVALGAVLTAVTVLLFGPAPFVEFIRDEMPRISSGAAFPQTEWPTAPQANLSVYGLMVRLRVLGLAFLDKPTGLAIASGYGLLIIALAAIAGVKAQPALTDARRRLRFVQVSLALLSLGSFRSPFVGFYGYVATVWLMTLLAAEARGAAAHIGAWIAIAAFCWGQWQIPAAATVPTRVQLVWSALLFLVALAVALFTVARALRVAPRDSPAAIPRATVTA